MHAERLAANIEFEVGLGEDKLAIGQKDCFVGVGCKMVVRLGEMSAGLAALSFGFVDFGQHMWVASPFGRVSTW